MQTRVEPHHNTIGGTAPPKEKKSLFNDKKKGFLGSQLYRDFKSES